MEFSYFSGSTCFSLSPERILWLNPIPRRLLLIIVLAALTLWCVPILSFSGNPFCKFQMHGKEPVLLDYFQVHGDTVILKPCEPVLVWRASAEPESLRGPAKLTLWWLEISVFLARSLSLSESDGGQALGLHQGGNRAGEFVIRVQGSPCKCEI